MNTDRLHLDVPVRRLDNITMEITVIETREWRVRRALGLWLIKIGARVFGSDVEVKAMKP